MRPPPRRPPPTPDELRNEAFLQSVALLYNGTAMIEGAVLEVTLTTDNMEYTYPVARGADGLFTSKTITLQGNMGDVVQVLVKHDELIQWDIEGATDG